MLGQNDIDQLVGRDVYGSDGDKIGTAAQVYTDDQTGKPEWVTVRTGFFGTKETFIPLADASMTSDGLTVPYDKAFVKDAPNMDEDGHLSVEQENELYDYYNRGGDNRSDYDRTDYDRTSAVDTAGTAAVGTADTRTDVTRTDDTRTDVTGADVTRDRDRTVGTEGYDASGPTTDEAMTVSEEQLSVGTERREVGRARLRKYVVTENVTQTVPVQREEVRLEREPITDANRDDALSGPGISEEEHEVVLHEERPVVQKETVPVERVRLDTETVTEQQTVADEVRKERVEVEDDTPGTGRA